MKRYIFELEIIETPDFGSFWEKVKDQSGCDYIKHTIQEALITKGFINRKDYNLKLLRFESKV